jgi:hypothetical protein
VRTCQTPAPQQRDPRAMPGQGAPRAAAYPLTPEGLNPSSRIVRWIPCFSFFSHVTETRSCFLDFTGVRTGASSPREVGPGTRGSTFAPHLARAIRAGGGKWGGRRKAWTLARGRRVPPTLSTISPASSTTPCRGRRNVRRVTYGMPSRKATRDLPGFSGRCRRRRTAGPNGSAAARAAARGWRPVGAKGCPVGADPRTAERHSPAGDFSPGASAKLFGRGKRERIREHASRTASLRSPARGTRSPARIPGVLFGASDPPLGEHPSGVLTRATAGLYVLVTAVGRAAGS